MLPNVDNPFKSPTVISFCPGILGIERGLARAGVHCCVAAYVEIEAFIIANLVAGMESGMVDPAPIWTDVKTFPREYFFHRVHGIIGGYPCTPFSLAGNRKGENDDRHLWPYIQATIRSTEPLWCFFENVDDHLSMGFDTVYKDLSFMGYRVEAGIYTAEEVGAPHERKRLFILALADNLCIQAIRDYQSGFFGITSGSCKELVNSPGIGQRKQTDEANAFATDRQTWNEPGNGSELVGDTCSQGLEIGQKQSVRQELPAIERASLWPAGQGIYQHDWEEPRTIESSLGCTIDGYNFREDLLRALGNSVVEQTAELAFMDLLQKHLKNL